MHINNVIAHGFAIVAALFLLWLCASTLRNAWRDGYFPERLGQRVELKTDPIGYWMAFAWQVLMCALAVALIIFAILRLAGIVPH